MSHVLAHCLMRPPKALTGKRSRGSSDENHFETMDAVNSSEAEALTGHPGTRTNGNGKAKQKAATTGDDSDEPELNRRELLPDHFGCCESVENWQVRVHQHHIRLQFQAHIDCFFAIAASPTTVIHSLLSSKIPNCSRK